MALGERSAAMTPTERAFHRDHARYMPLAGCPISEPGNLMVGRLLPTAVAYLEGQRRPSSVEKLRIALGALLADLFAAEAAGKWARRSLDNVSFTGQRVTRRMFAVVKDALVREGLMDWFKGFRCRKFVDALGQECSWGGQSCFKATQALIALGTNNGITADNWTDHFSAGRPRPPKGTPLILVRAAAQWNAEGKKQRGRILTDRTAQPRALELASEVESLNRYLTTGRVQGFAFAGLRRVFSNGDRAGFNWQWGGRFYSLPGADAYELWKGGADARCKSIKLDGQQVGEVDISACHLTILYGLAGVPFDGRDDPYALPNFRRETIKRYITIALGKGSVAPNGRWYAKVREAVIGRHPVLLQLEALGVTSLDLQFHESEILMDAMNRLKDSEGIVSLPIHDGLIVPEGATQVAKATVAESFDYYFRNMLGLDGGIYPRIS